ncbi:MAG: benzoyl-CoA-dihydrodiol lyase [Candidatus Poriferisodalaceae bacterium]|jgi:benzoyl-CoA-dihydrodiol lyase|tara:strand:+ start:5178 stop:6779 length:1602 start_codon:yes stop_codon:yes gene_type:complete
MIDFQRHPDQYSHWVLSVDDVIATLTLSVDPKAAAIGEYELKLNSYDIGVDIELADAIRRIRFEHPNTKCVVIDSALDGIFCAGANIQMLAGADHGHKINFCKFTNETRLEIEEASLHSGIRFLAAVRGACTGGGYELALACDHIILIDDKNTAVSLPEVPLLGVLPGTGGLTRLTDKRHLRRDIADVFATKAEGTRGEEALRSKLVDELASPTDFDMAVRYRAVQLSDATSRMGGSPAVLPELSIRVTDSQIQYRYVSASFKSQHVDIKISAAESSDWLLTTALELDDLLCRLRFNYPHLGTLLIRTSGPAESVLKHDQALNNPTTHAELETALLWKRTLSRMDLTARTLIAAIEPGSCFVGILFELALAADRSYMLSGIFEDDEEPLPAATIQLGDVNLGIFPMANGISRLASRFWGDSNSLANAVETRDTSLVASTAIERGLVTYTPDDLDWEEELRIAIEERSSFSPDALTAMEANHRFAGPETMATKIFARLSAWQNWIFTRPNASGPEGALRLYGTGSRPTYNTDRT